MAAITITSGFNSVVWAIRREIASQENRPVMEIKWCDCFRTAIRNARETKMISVKPRPQRRGKQKRKPAMKFYRKIEDRTTFYSGIKNGFAFEIYPYRTGYYCTAVHPKKDIRFNSLWEKLAFCDLIEAQNWCETFRAENFKCEGEVL